MTKHRTAILAGATLAALALPTVAQAHDATIACDTANPGRYIVQPDYLWLDPVTTFTPTGAVVTWRDGYVVRLPLPAGCVPPPPPPVVPPAPPVVPEAPVVPVVGAPPAPPVVTPGEPEPMPRKRVTPRKPVRVTCALLNARRAGVLEYTRRGWTYRCRPLPPPKKFGPHNPFKGVTG